MVFDKTNNPEVTVWNVELVKRIFNTLGDYKDVVIETTKLPEGTNYLFIPVKYRLMSYPTYYLVNVEGLNSSGSTIVSESSIQLNDNNNINDDVIEANGGFPYIETDCRKTCIGNLYAYHIQQFQKLGPSGPLNLSRFRLVHAYKSFDPQSQTANPYFWYSYQDMPSPTQVGPFISGPNGALTVFNNAGTPLIGLVYGHQKSLGVWSGQNEIETNGQFTIGSEFCGTTHTLNTAITLMNASAPNLQPGNPSNYPPLECIPAHGATGGGGGLPIGDPTPPKKFKDFVTFCFNPFTGLEEPCDASVNSPIISLLNPEIVDLIIIRDLNDNTKPPININVAELYNTNNGNGNITNGVFNGFNVTLTPSLYSFGFMFKESGYWAANKEVTKKIDFGVSQADMVDVTVFPNPITNNKYDVKVKAFATVKFDYELRDFAGELILTKNFVVHKGQEKTKKINDNNIPEGILFHRFVFEDGSVKTVQTIKN